MANPEKWIPIISITLIILQLVSGEIDQNNNMLVNIFYSIALGTGIYFLKNIFIGIVLLVGFLMLTYSKISINPENLMA